MNLKNPKAYINKRTNIKIFFLICTIPTFFAVLMYGYPAYNNFIGYILNALGLVFFGYFILLCVVLPVLLLDFYFFTKSKELEPAQWVINVLGILLLISVFFISVKTQPLFLAYENFLINNFEGVKSRNYYPGDEYVHPM